MLRRLLDSPAFYFAGAALLVVVALATQVDLRLPAQEEDDASQIAALKERDDLNVVFVVVDTLRADHLDSYGYPRETSPNLTALARHGIRFAEVTAQSSWTKTSMASLWTGVQPLNHGLTRFDDAMPSEAVMPAELFKARGYETAGVIRNGWVAANFGFDQGFDMYLRPRPGRQHLRAQSRQVGGLVLEGSDEDVLVSANEFLDAFGRRKFFLYLHFMDVHQYVYDQNAPEYGPRYIDGYDKAIHWTDRVIAHLYGKLEQLGVLDRTLIVITSDHGEAFREHGFEGHARNIFAEVVQVPWIIGLPFRLSEGIVVEQRVSNVDVWPTLLDLLGMEPLPNADGVSVVPWIEAAAGLREDPGPSPPQLAYLDRNWGTRDPSIAMLSVEEGGKRLIWWLESEEEAERMVLFDVEADPGEQVDLYSPDDPDGQRLLAMAKEHRDGATNAWGTDARQVELDELRLNQLRALGYALPGDQ